MLESEDTIHKSLIDYCKVRYREDDLIFHHSPNENPRANKTTIVRYNMKMKELGRQKGFPDLLFFRNGKTLLLEVKRKRGYLSPSQKELGKKLEKQNFPVKVCKSFDEGKEIIDRFYKES